MADYFINQCKNLSSSGQHDNDSFTLYTVPAGRGFAGNIVAYFKHGTINWSGEQFDQRWCHCNITGLNETVDLMNQFATFEEPPNVLNRTIRLKNFILKTGDALVLNTSTNNVMTSSSAFVWINGIESDL